MSTKIKASVYKDAKSVIFGFFGVFNEGKKHTVKQSYRDERGIEGNRDVEVFDVPYYAFNVHANGKEVAEGMFMSRVPCSRKWDKYFDRNKNRFVTPKDCGGECFWCR